MISQRHLLTDGVNCCIGRACELGGLGLLDDAMGVDDVALAFVAATSAACCSVPWNATDLKAVVDEELGEVAARLAAFSAPQRSMGPWSFAHAVASASPTMSLSKWSVERLRRDRRR